MCTLPSYMEELEQKAVAPQLPSATYKKEVAKAGIDTTHLAIKVPRNIKQVFELNAAISFSRTPFGMIPCIDMCNTNPCDIRTPHVQIGQLTPMVSLLEIS